MSTRYRAPRRVDEIVYGREPIELRGLEQLVDASQTRAIGHAIHAATERFIDGERSLAEVLDDVEAWLDREGLDGLDPFHRPDSTRATTHGRAA